MIKTCLLVHFNLNGTSLFIIMNYNYARATRSCSLSFINSLFVQNASKNRKLKTSHMELLTVSGMLGGVVYKGVNAPCITVLYLALKFHKALLSFHKALFTP